ncbi:MAG: hypothetical protein KDE47_11625, partial [Caldilineaceae bacterium]|nr:hypothetical protein [Caldilineaceae bacterium]
MSRLVRALLILGFFLPLLSIAALDAKSWFQDPKEWAKQDAEVFDDALDFRDWGVFAAHQKERTPTFQTLADGSWAHRMREVLPVLSNAVRTLRPGYRGVSYRLFGQTNPAVVV